MSEVSRRDALRRIGLALVATGLVDRMAGEEVHGFVRARQVAGATLAPRAFTAHEFRTLERLTDLIIPVEDGRPGAVAAGAAAWIDLIVSENDELRKIYKDGFRWLDAALVERGATDFAGATAGQQRALLDRIAYRRNETPALAPGIAFFSWVRRLPPRSSPFHSSMP